MLIRVGYDIIFEHPAPTPIIAMLYLHPSRGPSIRRGERLLVEPPVPVSEYTDAFGNRCGRLLAPAGPTRFWNDAVVEDDGRPDCQNPAAEQHEIHDLPDQILTFFTAEPLLRSGSNGGYRMTAFQRGAEGLGAGAGDLRFRAQPHPVRLHAGPQDPHRL
jgi:hypothetical protein